MDDRSLSEVHESVPVPQAQGFFRRLLAFAGPAYLVSVGYMDPGNWATDIAAGSRYGYALAWVLLASNLMALLLQSLAARLGLVAGRDLAQACRDRYPRAVNLSLWVLAEVAIAACDLAEVVGSAIGLNLLFGLPLAWGVVVTALDTFLILLLHQKGIRKMEAFILGLVATIGVSMLAEILLTRPAPGEVVRGFVPSFPDADALYFAVGILGATVMPHNLYLHSALVQSRKVVKTARGIFQSLKYNLVDSFVALNTAFLINLAILVVAAGTFHQAGMLEVADITEAHHLLEPILGSSLAPALFALSLIAAGQSSTITGTLAGQIVMEGYLNVRLRPWVRRIVTRAVAIVPALATIAWAGENRLGGLLVLSQVVLSLQLSFAVLPLVQMVSDARLMGAFAIRGWTRGAAWLVAGLIAVLNAALVAEALSGWLAAPGVAGVVAWAVVVPAGVLVVALLGFILVEPLLSKALVTGLRGVHRASVPLALEPAPPFRKVMAALDFGPRDRDVLARAAGVAASAKCPLLLVHVVESAGARALGGDVGDTESQTDLDRLRHYAVELGRYAVDVEVELGFGSPVRILPDLARRHGADLLVVGAHGHRGLADLVYGSTIDEVRHRLDCAVLVVRGV